MSTGLVLTGGGARGAWQAGFLRAIGEIAGGRPAPFRVLTGTSAGAINAAFLATRADDFPAATRELWRMWETLTPNTVFRTDAASLAQIGASWIADLGLGGFFRLNTGRALLDTAPLRALLDGVIAPAAIARHLATGHLDGLALSATRYDTGRGVTFYQSSRQVEPWVRRTRVSTAARLGVDHVLASSAIPFFFPAIAVDGAWYGDGCIQMHTPLSPAIHLGATHVLAIGVQHPPTRTRGTGYPSKAQTAGLLLDALFMDALDADVERAERINRTLALLPAAAPGLPASALHPLDLLAVQPSRDLGELGSHALRMLPAVLRHLLRGLGASDNEGWELVSYLAFDPAYTVPLLHAGYTEGQARAAEIAAFLERAGRLAPTG